MLVIIMRGGRASSGEDRGGYARRTRPTLSLYVLVVRSLHGGDKITDFSAGQPASSSPGTVLVRSSMLKNKHHP